MAERKRGRETDEDVLDSQNRQMADELKHKVSRLKSLAFDIEHETHEHNRLLDDVDANFSSNQGLLSSTLNRIHGVSSSGRSNRRFMCYTMLLVVGVFFALYYTVTKLSQTNSS